MANIVNRSPWLITCPNQPEAKIRLKSKAQAHLESLNHPKAKMFQLETAFEVQLKRVDKEGNVIKLTKTFDTEAKAKVWADEEENRLLDYKKQHGKFDTTQETMTIEEGLNLLCEEHYKNKASYDEQKYRVPHIVEFFGKKKLIKDITKLDVSKYKKHLKEKGYAPSTIKNNFALLSMLFKHANSEWVFNLPNPTADIKLDKPDNNIERYWEDKGEKERLMKAIEEHRPNLKNLVLLCLDLTFRIGELLPKAFADKHGNTDKYKDKGLFWGNVSFEKNEIKLTHEKNDHTKRNTETKGRTVPLSNVAKAILLEEWNKQGNPKPTDRVFPFSYNTARPQLDFCTKQAGIENFTWHSTRKIGMVDIVNKMNILQAVAISGHKTVQIVKDRYYKPNIADLKALLDEIDTNNPILRGFLLLEKHLGQEFAEEFVKFVQKTKTAKDKPQIEQLKIICDRPALEEVAN